MHHDWAVFIIGIAGLKLRDYCKPRFTGVSCKPILRSKRPQALQVLCASVISQSVSKLPPAFQLSPLTTPVLMTDTWKRTLAPKPESYLYPGWAVFIIVTVGRRRRRTPANDNFDDLHLHFQPANTKCKMFSAFRGFHYPMQAIIFGLRRNTQSSRRADEDERPPARKQWRQQCEEHSARRFMERSLARCVSFGFRPCLV